MLRLILPLFALLTGVALAMLGASLLHTAVATTATARGAGGLALGLLASGYFAGFLLGTQWMPGIIGRIGHVRAFAACAALAVCAVLGHGLHGDTVWWLLMRVATGFALVGIYSVIESWLNASTPQDQRAQVFAVYMIVHLLAMALGQQLLRLDQFGELGWVMLAALALAASVLPVTWTVLAQPQPSVLRRTPLMESFRQAPSALIGGGLSGMLMGALWGLLPAFGAMRGLIAAEIATLMSIVVLGGALAQVPLGYLSARLDRRQMLAAVGALSALIALGLLFAERPVVLYLGFAGFGALAFAIYPLSIGHLLDRVTPDQIVPASCNLLLINGLGAMSGPLLAGFAVAQLGPAGLLWHFVWLGLALAVFCGWRRGQRSASPHHSHLRGMVRTTPAAFELMPETSSELDSERAAERS